MAPSRRLRHPQFRAILRAALSGPQALAFMPALTLFAFWIGGEAALLYIAILMPALFAIAGLFTRWPGGQAPDDELTGLPRRDRAIGLCAELLRRTSDEDTICAIAIGIDGFDHIARRNGTAAADAVLRTCAERLRTFTGKAGVAARLDGADFVLVASVTRPPKHVAEDLVMRLNDPVHVDDAVIRISVSAGYAVADDRDPNRLLRNAERALRDALNDGSRTLREHSDEIERRVRTKDRAVSELPSALDNGEIVPWFQPQIYLESGGIAGCEALARWQHPDRGWISPGEFLPTLEDLGLLERLGVAMLDRSLAALRGWDETGLRIPTVSINFSAAELRNPAIVETILWELDRYGLTPQRVTVEVLETVVAQSAHDLVLRNLRAFSEMGFTIDLDDFGTGHASITNIKQFSVGRIKIDRSFVSGIDSNPDQQSIVAAIITLAERLDLKTLAEGIETEAELSVLRELGCTYGQGFAIARPMPPERIPDWVAERRAHRHFATASAARMRLDAGKTA